jgi:hypothetical protein
MWCVVCCYGNVLVNVVCYGNVLVNVVCCYGNVLLSVVCGVLLWQCVGKCGVWCVVMAMCW